jgi:hypothetical protein
MDSDDPRLGEAVDLLVDDLRKLGLYVRTVAPIQVPGQPFMVAVDLSVGEIAFQEPVEEVVEKPKAPVDHDQLNAMLDLREEFRRRIANGEPLFD